jgi:hypothetical protein
LSPNPGDFARRRRYRTILRLQAAGRTSEEIGRKLGIDASRVRQIAAAGPPQAWGRPTSRLLRLGGQPRNRLLARTNVLVRAIEVCEGELRAYRTELAQVQEELASRDIDNLLGLDLKP